MSDKKHRQGCVMDTDHNGACWTQPAAMTQYAHPANIPNDPVNPLHYVKGGIEVRHVIRAFECTYNVGTAVAYLLRAQFKKDYAEDLRKAMKHIQFELEDKKP